MSSKPASASSRKPGSLTVLSLEAVSADGPDTLLRLTARWSGKAPTRDVQLAIGERRIPSLDGSVGTTQSKRHGPRWRAAFAVPRELLADSAVCRLVVADRTYPLPAPTGPVADDLPPAPPVDPPAAPPVAPTIERAAEGPSAPSPAVVPAAPPDQDDAERWRVYADALEEELARVREENDALREALREAEHLQELRALDGEDQPVFTLPALDDRQQGTATAMLAVGAALVAVAAAFAALRIGVLAPKALSVLLLASAAGIALLWRPEWLIPVFLGLTWTSIGGSFFGGFPSPIELGGIVLTPVAGWVALSRLRYAREVVIIFGLIMLPVVATGLTSPEGPMIGTDRLKDLLFLLVCGMCIRGTRDVERTFLAFAVTAVFLGIGAVYSVRVHPTTLFPLNETPTSDQAARAAGPFGESNFFALSLAALVPLLLHVMNQGGWRTLLGGAGLLSCTAGILAAGSRGGLIAAGAGVVLFGLVTGGRARVACAVALAAAAAMVPAFAAQAQSSSNRTVDGRLTENLIAATMFAEHPLVGVGPERYPDLYRDYTRRIGNDPRYRRAPHSLPLEIAAEQGLAGLLGWLGAAIALVQFARRRGLWQQPVARALLLSIVTFGVGSIFLHGSQLRLLYVLVGLTLACGAAPRRRPGLVPA